MAEYNVEKIKIKLKEDLTTSRYNHSIGVAYTAISLSMRYNYNYKKAEVAGLLHDCGKCINNKDKITICKENNIEIREIEMANPELLHAKLGSYLAQKKYGIKHISIINAIKYHTTGKPEMTLLDKIIFVADYIEPGRNKAENLKKIRTLAYLDIDMCVYTILEDTIRYIKSNNKLMDSITEDAHKYYSKLWQDK